MVRMGHCSACSPLGLLYFHESRACVFPPLSVEEEEPKKIAGENRERAGSRHKVLASGKSDADGGQIDTGTERACVALIVSACATKICGITVYTLRVRGFCDAFEKQALLLLQYFPVSASHDCVLDFDALLEENIYWFWSWCHVILNISTCGNQ